jgi:membrane-associated protease RseP (regulator of RpoE activity)
MLKDGDAMDTPLDYSLLLSFVERVLVVEDTTMGDAKQNFIIRYRGKLRMESEIAYDRLADLLKPHSLTPLFRRDDDRHAVLLVPGLPQTTPSSSRTNLIMFILTLLSVLWTGGVMSMEQELPANPILAGWILIQAGFPYAISLLLILGAHEMAHYFVGKRHGVNVTLPYFIPLPYPLSPFGTMGAFINMKSRPKNRKHLLDIGLAGPLAGLVVAIVVVLIGLSLSEVGQVNAQPGGNLMEGNSLLYLGLKYMTFGRVLPEPASFGGVSPFLYWIGYFFTGTPAPMGGMDVMIHPIVWAGWAGLLVTAMNLLPVGQLDGGHVLYVLFGEKRSKKIVPVILLALVLLGFAWEGWWLWAILIFFLGRSHAEPLDMITELDKPRKRLAVLGLVVFILVFVPVPLVIF